MAKVTFTGLDDYIEQLRTLEKTTVPACKRALYEMADVYADAIRAGLAPYQKTGSLFNSLDVARHNENNGVIQTYIGVYGYDENGTPNPLKANILESGTSNGHVKKTHFFSNAVKGAKAAAEQAAVAAFDQYTKTITKG